MAARPRVPSSRTPTRSSRNNLVERSFVELSEKQIRPAFLLLALAAALAAQEPASGSDRAPPPIRKWRYDEDYSYLRAEPDATGSWWEALKYIPHGEGDLHLTFGAEFRIRYEAYANDLWGGAPVPDHDYFWLRAMPYVDLHAGERFRAFAQLVSAVEIDDEAGLSPPDEDRADILQAFADLALPLEDSKLTVRGGRQVLAYGSERLISARYGPNVLRSFDAAKVLCEGKGWRLDLLACRPVDNKPGAFDDSSSDTQALWAAYATVDLARNRAAGLDLYYIGYENEDAAFNQGAGREMRHTFGTRWFGDDGAWDWNFELMGQFGTFAGGDIRAWSIASDSGYTLRDVALRPRLGLKANIISGDHDPTGKDLQTFNPLFPNGKYFGEIGVLGPYNLVNLQPSIALALTSQWTLKLGNACYWRQSQGDGIYDNAGNLLRGDGGSGARYIGTQLDTVLEFAADRTFDITLSWSTLWPGAFIRDTGPDETIRFASAELRFIF
jgi:hypothetical protein